jgi:hypothetical protein
MRTRTSGKVRRLTQPATTRSSVNLVGTGRRIRITLYQKPEPEHINNGVDLRTPYRQITFTCLHYFLFSSAFEDLQSFTFQFLFFTMTSTNNYDHIPDGITPQTIHKRASASKPSAYGSRMQPVVKVDFQPSNYSIVCGRSKKASNHPGNRNFRFLTTMFVKRYSRADSKTAKSDIVSEILTMIHQLDGNFYKYKSGAWFEVGERYAREKVTSLLRDLLHTQYRSSNKAKSARRSAQTRLRNENKNEENQQSGQQLLDDNGGQPDDSSLSSSCWGSNKDSLGFDDNSPEYDFFDIEVF